MTFLEKYCEDHPSDGRSEGRIITLNCPSDFGYEPDDDPCPVNCRECWNREVPE